jgi:hypothetical protein
MATRKSALWVPERAEIIFIQYRPTVGEEVPCDRPMQVISTKAFNESTNFFLRLLNDPRRTPCGQPVRHPGARGPGRGPLPADLQAYLIRDQPQRLNR